METLTQGYEDRLRTEQQHVYALSCLPQEKSVTGTKGLRKLYDATHIHVQCLKSIGLWTMGYSAILCKSLEKALPYETVTEYCRRESLKEMFGQMLQAERASEASPASPSHSCTKLKGFLEILRINTESLE